MRVLFLAADLLPSVVLSVESGAMVQYLTIVGIVLLASH
jgi:hypothetical protein